MTGATIHTLRPGRAAHSNAPQGTARMQTLVAYVVDRPGSIDRVIGVLRRRRAGMQTLVIGRTEKPDVVRITALISDAEVSVYHVVEFLRKTVDVQKVEHLTQPVARELALIKVSGTPANFSEIIEHGQHFGAHVVDMTTETVTFEVTGSEEKVDELVDVLRSYGIREVARSGRVAIARGGE